MDFTTCDILQFKYSSLFKAKFVFYFNVHGWCESRTKCWWRKCQSKWLRKTKCWPLLGQEGQNLHRNKTLRQEDKMPVLSKDLIYFYYVHPTGVIFVFFQRSPSVVTFGFRSFQGKNIYPIFTKFGMGVYWVNSLHRIAFGEDSCIAN